MPSLEEAHAALQSKLSGSPPSQTIELAAAAADPRLAGLGEPLALLRAGSGLEVTAAALERPYEAVKLSGSASLALPGQGLGVAVAATLTVTEPGPGTLAFALDLAVTRPGWKFEDSFATLPQTLRADGPELGFGESALKGLRIDSPTFSARSGAGEQVRLTGSLVPSAALEDFESWVGPWPLALTGTVALPAAAGEAPGLDLAATAPEGQVKLGSLTLTRPGFGIFAGTEPSPPDEPPPPPFSQLEFIGTVTLGGESPVAARLSAPLLVSSSGWRLMIDFEGAGESPPPILGGLAQLAGLFGPAAADLPTPPALGGFESFRLAEVEVWADGGPSLGLTGVGAIAVTIVSDKVWKPPVPFLAAVKEVGTRWVMSKFPVEGKTQTGLTGSVFGSFLFDNGGSGQPGIVDVSGELPSFVLQGEQREGTLIDVVAAFKQLLGLEVPPPNGSHPQLADLGLYADPASQVFEASGRLELEWPVPFFATGVSITEISFEVAATQAVLSGALEGRLQLAQPTPSEPLVPALFLRAEAPGDAEGGWVFSAGLEAGAPLTLPQLFAVVGIALPGALAAVRIDRLEGSIETKDEAWTLAGALSAGWEPTLFGTPLQIAAGVEFDLAKAAPPAGALLTDGAGPSGWVAGRFSVNRFALSLRQDVGVAQPTCALRLQFGQVWLQAVTAWVTEGKDPPYEVLAIQLGGVTLGDVLEEIVNLAAPTLGFSLEPPWDVLKRIELSRFTLTVDLRPEHRKVALTYAVEADLVLLYLDTIEVSYTMGDSSKVELSVSGRLLDKEFGGKSGQPPLQWDVVDDPPPAVPGKGPKLIELRYLGLGQRVRLKTMPETVAGAIAALRKEMLPEKPGQKDPLGAGMVFDDAGEWLIGLDLRLLETVEVALVFSDPGLYGLSVALDGERAGALAGLRFEILYKQLAPGLGMFRVELRIPEAFRHIELGEVSVTLGLVVVEVYTNGNFLIDLGFPHERDYQRSFTVEVFPFVGRGGIYFGVLNGMTSRRVPAIANGTFSPVLELGVGLAVGIGKEISIGPLSGGAYLELEAIFQGVLGWFHPTASDAPGARYHWAKAVVALHGKVWGEVDFGVVKASVTLEAYAQATAVFESYRATVFELQVRVEAEAKIKILFVSVSFSFDVELDLSFTIGSDEPTPWALASAQPPQPQTLRSPRRLAGHQRAQLLAVAGEGRWCWPQDFSVFAPAKDIEAWMLPTFSVRDAPVQWTATPGPEGMPDPDPKPLMALPLFLANGLDHGARTAAENAQSAGGSTSPLADVVEALLRWSLNAVPAIGKPGLVTAGQLEQLATEMTKDYVAEKCFSRDHLASFFEQNFILRIGGDPGGIEPVAATAFPPPPWLQIAVKPEGSSDLFTEPAVGPHYLRGASAYMASFSPAGAPPEPNPDDDPGKYESFSSHVFRDWCLMVARESVRQARLALAETTVPMGADLKSTAATLPEDTVAYTVRLGDTIEGVAAWLGAGVAELEELNPKLVGQLGEALPGASLDVTVGVGGCTLAVDNAERQLAPGLTVTVKEVSVQVRAGDTLKGIAERLYGTPAPQRLLADASLGLDTRLLRAGARLEVPARSGMATDLPLLAATAWVRYFADAGVPDCGWYAQTVAAANEAALRLLAPGQAIPAGTSLAVPPSFGATPTATYVAQTGDTLLRIGATLSLAQRPDLYENPAWGKFRGEVKLGAGGELPKATATVLPGESLEALAERLLLSGAAALLPWLEAQPLLDPLAAIELPSLALSTAELPRLVDLAAAAGLTIEALARRPEIVKAAGLFAAGTKLTVRQLPAQSVEALVTAVKGAGPFAAIATQASRNLLAGVRLPKPEADAKGVVSASGELTGMAELAGWQLPAPAPDDRIDLTVTVSASGPKQAWIVLPENGLRLFYSSSEREALYPAMGLEREPRFPAHAIELTGTVPRTYGLDHRIALQSAVALAIPPPSPPPTPSPPAPAPLTGTATFRSLPPPPPPTPPALEPPAGTASLWTFPAALAARARAGTTIPYAVLRATVPGAGADRHDPVKSCTFGTLVPFRVRRVAGREHLYELIGADSAERELLRELALYTRGETVAGRTAAYLGVPPVPGFHDPSGLAVLAADPAATFAIRTNMATDVPLAEPPATVVAGLGDLSHFLQLLWEGSVAESGYHLGFATSDGQDLPAGAFGDDGTATIWLLAIPREQQGPPGAGRPLLAFDNCALVADGIDSSAHALYVEADEAHLHREELVPQALVPAGSAGVTLTVHQAPAEDDTAAARLERLLSLLVMRVGVEGETYVAAKAAPAAPPQREDGLQLPRWRRQRLQRAARLRGDPPDPSPAPYWRYDQVVRLSELGPPSVAPAVLGLPDPRRDPYRGFGAAEKLPEATFHLGYADVFGNVTAESSDKPVEVPIGYVDPLLGPGAWPGATTGFGVAVVDGTATLTVTVAAQPSVAAPAPGQEAREAATAAAKQAERYAEAYFQLAQPTVAAWLVTTLHRDAGGAAKPLKLETAPLWRFTAAGYLYAGAAATLEPPSLAGIATLEALEKRYGVAADALAPANAGRPFAGLARPGQEVAVAARVAFTEGDSAATLRERAPATWPKPATATALLELGENLELALRPGTVLETAPVTFTLPADAAALTLPGVAGEHSTTPAQLAIDCAGLAILRPGFSFQAGGHLVAVDGEEVKSFADVQARFAALAIDVACSELAAAAGEAKGVFADAAELTLEHAVASGTDTLATLAAAGRTGLAEKNAGRANLFPAGAMVSLGCAWPVQPLVPSDETTLAEFAARHGSSAALVLTENKSLGLSPKPGPIVPGIAVLPATPPAAVPYTIAAGDTLEALAVVLGMTPAAIATANAEAPGLLVGDRPVAVEVAGTAYRATTAAGETLTALTARLQSQCSEIDLAALATAIEGDATILAGGGLLLVSAPPPLAARPQVGVPAPTVLTQAQVEAAYGLDALSFAQANAMLPGLLSEGISLAVAGGSEPTVAADSFNAVLSRLAARGVTADLRELLEANLALPMFRAAQRVLLAPKPVSVSAPLEDEDGDRVHDPVFPLSVVLRLQRDQAVVLEPTSGGDGPVERADTTVPAPMAPQADDGASAETLDPFVRSFEAPLPGLRLGTARVEGTAADLWVVDLTANGIASVEVAPTVAYPDGTKGHPRYLALRPLYSSLQSRSGVWVPKLDPSTGAILPNQATPTDFQGIDVEVWARRLLGDLDLFVSAPYAAAIYSGGPDGALARLLASRWKLSQGIAAGLAPVLAVDDPGAVTGRAAAVTDLARMAGEGLVAAYDVSTVVQFEATVESAYTDPTHGLKPALLLGGAEPPAPPAEPTEYSLTRAATALGSSPTHVGFAMTVPDPAHRRSVAMGPLEYAYDSVEFDIDPVAGVDGYVASDRVSLVHAFAGSDRPANIVGDLGSPVVPVPLRSHPAVPLVLGQTARATHQGGEGQPTLAEASQWTYGLTYSHEHAEQDAVLLAVTFNLAPALQAPPPRPTDLAASLGKYAVLGDRLRDLMSWYAEPPSPPPVNLEAVRKNVAASVATLVEEIAQAWGAHWPHLELGDVVPAGPQTDLPAGDTYHFRVEVEYGRGSTLAALTLELDGSAAPGPTGTWPMVSVQGPDGSFAKLDGVRVSDAEWRYTPLIGASIPIPGWPVVRLEWPGLSVATVGNAQASLSARRNERLLPGVPTNASFVLGSAGVTAPDVATPMLVWSGDFPISGATLAEALGAAITDLFGDATLPSLTVSLSYSHRLVEPAPGDPESGLKSVLPSALYPHQSLSGPIATAVAQAASSWQAIHRPATTGGEWLVSLSLSSWLGKGASHPLLVLDRLAYPLAAAASAPPHPLQSQGGDVASP